MHLISEVKPVGKFIALFSDGSGARLYWQADNDLRNAEGVYCDERELDHYSHWVQLPETYELFFEGRYDERG